MLIPILYMFRATMFPSTGELTYQCDTWYMSLCVDDRLVCRFHPKLHTRRSSTHRVTYTRHRIDKLILMMTGTWLPETCRE